MKNIQVILLLMALIATAYCINHQVGWNTITIAGNDDPQACLLTLGVSLTANAVTFTENVYNPFQDCTYQNLTYKSQFRLDASLTGQVTLAPTGTPNVYSGVMTTADIAAYNGTACSSLGDYTGNADYYICQFKYGSVLFNIWLFVYNNGTIDPNWDGLFFPVHGSTTVVWQNNTYVWKSSNQSFPHFVGMLYSQCGGWSTSISNLNNPVYVTGTEYASNQYNLKPYFGNFILYSIMIRKKAAPYNDYLVKVIYNYGFNNPPNGNCTNLGITYGQLVPDLNYCKDGCEMSIFLETSEVYILQTSGFTTVPSRLRA